MAHVLISAKILTICVKLRMAVRADPNPKRACLSGAAAPGARRELLPRAAGAERYFLPLPTAGAGGACFLSCAAFA